jgi:hypothetical protein
MGRVFAALLFVLAASAVVGAQAIPRRVELVAGYAQMDPRTCNLPTLPNTIVARWIPDSTRDRLVWCIDLDPRVAQVQLYVLHVNNSADPTTWVDFHLAPVCGYSATVSGVAETARSFCSSYMHPDLEAKLLQPGGHKELEISYRPNMQTPLGNRSEGVSYDVPRCIGYDLSGPWPVVDNKVYDIGESLSARRRWNTAAHTAAVGFLRRWGWRVEHGREQYREPSAETGAGSLDGGFFYLYAWCVGFSTL